jgi:hypothetical protein
VGFALTQLLARIVKYFEAAWIPDSPFFLPILPPSLRYGATGAELVENGFRDDGKEAPFPC